MITVSDATCMVYLLNLVTEVAYLLRYMEENGRNHGNPWSLRQIGAYQQVNTKDRTSAWIFLRLSGSTRRYLEREVQDMTYKTKDPFIKLHCSLILDTPDNWGRYIEYLHS